MQASSGELREGLSNAPGTLSAIGQTSTALPAIETGG